MSLHDDATRLNRRWRILCAVTARTFGIDRLARWLSEHLTKGENR